jgi:hypothetical protein
MGKTLSPQPHWLAALTPTPGDRYGRGIPMSQKITARLLLSFLALATLSGTGCVGITAGPNFGLLGVPIPVSPYFQKMEEDEFWNKERYERVPILGTAHRGRTGRGPRSSERRRGDAGLRKGRPIQGGLPFLHEVQRNNVRIVIEKIADYVDPPRFVPLIGPAQLHHAHYKCTIYYTEVTRVGWPIPYTTRNEDAREVIYIDHNHFHMVGNVDTGVSSPY